jgi:hypothetical protein
MFAAPDYHNESQRAHPDQGFLKKCRGKRGFRNEEHEYLADRDHGEKRDGQSGPR